MTKPPHMPGDNHEDASDGNRDPDRAKEGPSLRGRAVRGGVFSISSQIIRFVVQTVTTLILAAHLAPNAFGVVAIAVSIQAFLAVLRDSGLPNALIQKADATELHYCSLFWSQSFVSVVLAALLVLLAPLAASYMGEPQLKVILALISLCILAQGITGVQEARLRKDIRFGYLGLADTLGTMASAVVAIVAVLLGAGIWSLVLRIIVYPVVRSASCWYLSDWRPAASFSFPALRSLWKFGRYIMLSGIVGYGLTQLDSPLITKISGVSAAGVFFMARSLALRPFEQALNAIVQVLFPTFSKIQDDTAALRSAFSSGVRVVCLLMFPAVAGMIAVAPEAIPLILGEKWLGALPAVQILGLQGFLLSVNYPSAQILLARGRSRCMFVISMFRGPAILAAFVVGAYWGGIIGVAVGYTAVRFIIAPIGIVLAARELSQPLSSLAKAILPPFISASGMLVLVRTAAWIWPDAWGRPSWCLFCLELLVGVVVYLTFCYAMMPETVRSLIVDMRGVLPNSSSRRSP
jgi:O-antigen/teichoic acid export membrane protein